MADLFILVSFMVKNGLLFTPYKDSASAMALSVLWSNGTEPHVEEARTCPFGLGLVNLHFLVEPNSKTPTYTLMLFGDKQPRTRHSVRVACGQAYTMDSDALKTHRHSSIVESPLVFKLALRVGFVQTNTMVQSASFGFAAPAELTQKEQQVLREWPENHKKKRQGSNNNDQQLKKKQKQGWTQQVHDGAHALLGLSNHNNEEHNEAWRNRLLRLVSKGKYYAKGMEECTNAKARDNIVHDVANMKFMHFGSDCTPDEYKIEGADKPAGGYLRKFLINADNQQGSIANPVDLKRTARLFWSLLEHYPESHMDFTHDESAQDYFRKVFLRISLRVRNLPETQVSNSGIPSPSHMPLLDA